MKLYKYKGKRIRASDKSLVFHFYTGIYITISLVILFMLHYQQLMSIDWNTITLDSLSQFIITAYHVFTVIVALFVCVILSYLYYRFCFDRMKQLQHRQELARMILNNHWYETETVQGDSFFTDLNKGSREKISYFPKLYYRMDKGLLHIKCEITLGKYQDQLLNLEKKLESGLYCELVDKVLHDSYIEYTLLYDTIANRIIIEDVQAENGKLHIYI